MAQLTEKQLEDKLRFAGETIPSMTRRRDGHDYEARQMYLIAITVEGRRPLLGRVVGNPEAAEGATEVPRIELSPLGKAVEQDWMAISHYHPEVKVIALQIMPDHLHSIPIAIRKHAKLKASMLQDLEKGKLTEVDAINGAVSAYGRQVGCPTPMNDCVVQIIHDIEQGKLKPGFNNLRYFK